MSGKAICVFFGSKITLNPSHTSERRAQGEAEAEWLQNSMNGGEIAVTPLPHFGFYWNYFHEQRKKCTS